MPASRSIVRAPQLAPTPKGPAESSDSPDLSLNHDDPLLTLREIARERRVSVGRVRAWICDGVSRGKGSVNIKLVADPNPGLLMVRRSELERFLKACMEGRPKLVSEQDAVRAVRPLASIVGADPPAQYPPKRRRRAAV